MLLYQKKGAAPPKATTATAARTRRRQDKDPIVAFNVFFCSCLCLSFVRIKRKISELLSTSLIEKKMKDNKTLKFVLTSWRDAINKKSYIYLPSKAWQLNSFTSVETKFIK